MSDEKDNGKVILSLLVGATAGIVAGLLLAPETGDDTRSGLRRSASKWGGELRKLLQNAVADQPSGSEATADARTVGGANPDAALSEDRQAADRLLSGLGRSASTAHTHNDDNPDYDGFGDDTRHNRGR